MTKSSTTPAARRSSINEWNKYYQALQTLKTKTGNCNTIPVGHQIQGSISSVQLRSWSDKQRRLYASSKLDNSRVDKLKELKFDFNIMKKNKKTAVSSLFNRRSNKKKQTKTKIDEAELKSLVTSINLSSKQEAKLMKHYVGRKHILIEHLKTLKAKQDEQMEQQSNLDAIAAAAADGTVVANDTTDMDSCLDKIIESTTDNDENKSLLSELTNPKFIASRTKEEEYLTLSKLLKMASVSVGEDEHQGNTTNFEQDALSLVDSIGNKFAMGFKDMLSTVVEDQDNIDAVATNEEQDGNIVVESPEKEVAQKESGCIMTQWEEFEQLMTSMNFCMPMSSNTNKDLKTSESTQAEELKSLLQNANIKREDSLLSRFAGEEDKLIAHLKRYQNEKEQKAELNSLLKTAEFKKSKTKTKLLEKYAGREDVLVANLKRYQDETKNAVDVREDDRNDVENPAAGIIEEVRA